LKKILILIITIASCLPIGSYAETNQETGSPQINYEQQSSSSSRQYKTPGYKFVFTGVVLSGLTLAVTYGYARKFYSADSILIRGIAAMGLLGGAYFSVLPLFNLYELFYVAPARFRKIESLKAHKG